MSGAVAIGGISSFLSMSVSSFVSMLLLDFLSWSSFKSCFESRMIDSDVSLSLSAAAAPAASSMDVSRSFLPNVNDCPLLDFCVVY